MVKAVRQASSLFLIASVVALASAYIMEYAFGILPCELCTYQRVIYYCSLALSLMGLFFRKKVLIRLLAVSYLLNMLLALYQVAVENHWIKNIISCGGNIEFSKLTDEQIINGMFSTPTISCDVPQLSILGISIAGWNMIYCSIILIIYLYYATKCKVSTGKK